MFSLLLLIVGTVGGAYYSVKNTDQVKGWFAKVGLTV